MGEMEIIPPNRGVVEPRRTGGVASLDARMDPGDFLETTFTRWRAARHARALSAVAERTKAETAVLRAQSDLMEVGIAWARKEAQVREIPEIIEADRAMRRAARAEELRSLLHQYEISEVRRQTELARVQTVLGDSRQSLRAQSEYGYSVYEIEWKKRQAELLDVEMSIEERREMLREHYAELRRSRGQEEPAPRQARDDDENVDNALFEARAQMRASGLDTSRIDALIKSRTGRP